MSFLAPVFLFGALAVLGPLLLHLIRRSTREKVAFSTLMFLRESPPRVTRRSRLEHLLLLLLRCLTVLLLALAFARPFFRTTGSEPLASQSEVRSMVILLDASASMGRTGLVEAAKEKVRAVLRSTKPADEVAIVAFARGTNTLLSTEAWKAAPFAERETLAEEALAHYSAGWGTTALGSALVRAAEWLETAQGIRLIAVVSDFQEGSRMDGLLGFTWPDGLRVDLHPVGVGQKPNAALHLLGDTTGEVEDGVRVRVSNAVDAEKEQLQLIWRPATPEPVQDVYVPAGQSRIVSIPRPPAGATQLVLNGDAEPWDNVIHFLTPDPLRLRVHFCGSTKADDAQGTLYFLRRAFPPVARRITDLSYGDGAGQLINAHLLIAEETASAAEIDAIRTTVSEGKSALILLSSSSAEPVLERLLGARLPVREAASGSHVLLTDLDFTHPVFQPFADPRYSDFTKIHIWHHRVLDIAALKQSRVLARFDDGNPALVEVPLGKGAFYLLTTTWRPADSQLALSSKFVPLLHALLEHASRVPEQAVQYLVGDVVALPPGTLAVRDPAGVQVPASGSFEGTDRPGIYTIEPGERRFVVNMAEEESRVMPLDPARLRAVGVPLDGAANSVTSNQAEPLRDAALEQERRQQPWRWVLISLIVLLLTETLLANRKAEPSSA